MKIMEVISAPAPQITTFWHVTPHTRLKSIMTQGLVPSRRRQWKNVMGARVGETKKVYLFDNFDSAVQFASRLEWGLAGEKRKVTQVDILELQTDVPLEPDDHIESQLDPHGQWWKTAKPIPPNAIVKITPLTREMKKDYIARRDGKTAEPSVAGGGVSDQGAEPNVAQQVVGGDEGPYNQ